MTDRATLVERLTVFRRMLFHADALALKPTKPNEVETTQITKRESELLQDALGEAIERLANADLLESSITPKDGLREALVEARGHIHAMQHQARQYVEPSGYTSFDRKRIAFSYDQEAKDSLFTNDMIYLLDGPEQRALEAKIDAALSSTAPIVDGDNA